MKALFCGLCFSVRSFDPTGKEWRLCDCERMAARWSDPDRGTVEVLAVVPDRTFIIGLNNRFLTSALSSSKSNQAWREIHAACTTSPGYVFDASNRACWACILRVGETSDITWHREQRTIEAGATVKEAIKLSESNGHASEIPEKH